MRTVRFNRNTVLQFYVSPALNRCVIWPGFFRLRLFIAKNYSIYLRMWCTKWTLIKVYPNVVMIFLMFLSALVRITSPLGVQDSLMKVPLAFAILASNCFRSCNVSNNEAIFPTDKFSIYLFCDLPATFLGVIKLAFLAGLLPCPDAASSRISGSIFENKSSN
jgi:hypothetical protein